MTLPPSQAATATPGGTPAPEAPRVAWPLWLALSALLLLVPVLIWTSRAWWPGWGAVLGLVVPDFCEVPPAVADREAARRSFYEGYASLQPEDVVAAILFALDAPQRMDVTLMEIMPTDQVYGGSAFAKDT